ncbi:hypothetical protein RI444_08695 [Paenarthrobacter sp. AT5]|uniref:hypothetical protein n=1 Tax=Paenarthrobacter TaxID=1742992 RepID=UPI001A993D1D|nr:MULTISPECIES: hypothetical protein [Paenarthrobacter]QSZ53893.1 hypothetical protein AYX19_13440 [Paenarthrobacter ureafaciens]WOC62673.1 hypothetical protein RI444_08695 [Paenarthrobacter sp. AT5]
MNTFHLVLAVFTFAVQYVGLSVAEDGETFLDETIKYRPELMGMAEELERLNVKRRELVRQYDASQDSFKPKYNESEQAVSARRIALEVNFHKDMIRLEEEMHQLLARERNAREQLAEATHKLDEHLRAVESQAYATARPPLGRELRLTEQDYRQAQRGVPPIATTALHRTWRKAVDRDTVLSQPTSRPLREWPACSRSTPRS